jgi:hypothetical protein
MQAHQETGVKCAQHASTFISVISQNVSSTLLWLLTSPQDSLGFFLFPMDAAQIASKSINAHFLCVSVNIWAFLVKIPRSTMFVMIKIKKIKGMTKKFKNHQRFFS